MKRFRQQHAKPGQLKVSYGRADGEADVVFSWGDGVPKSDANFLMDALGTATQKELVARGYDLTTLKFTIQKAAT